VSRFKRRKRIKLYEKPWLTYGAVNVLHGVVHGKTRRHDASRRIDVHVHGLVRLFAFQKKELGGYEATHVVGDGTVYAHDSFSQKPGINVKASLPQCPLLEDDGNRERERPTRYTCCCGMTVIWRKSRR
jgi:hypothetical protein